MPLFMAFYVALVVAFQLFTDYESVTDGWLEEYRDRNDFTATVGTQNTRYSLFSDVAVMIFIGLVEAC